MSRIRWQDRIVIDPSIHHGTPCVKGTRIPVSIVVGSLADGMEVSEIIRQYPQLTAEDVAAALSYAAEVTREELVLPLAG